MRTQQWGRVESLGEPPFWVVINSGGAVVEVIETFLLDFWASGNAESSSRSYAFGLLRWFRHLELEGVGWERASRETVRDFVLACRQPSALSSRTLSPRTINHNLAVVSEFYAFLVSQLQGPLVNPVPQQQGRGGRFAAHQNPESSFRYDRRADLRQRVPETMPRAIPEERVVELFRVVEHPRDRALLAFYLSSAARPSELLGLRFEDVDPGSQQITVVRKGTRARQVVPASSAAFTWLRIYQEQLPPDRARAGEPVWWTLRRPLRPLNYDAARALLRRASEQLGARVKLHDLRHTAAAQMAQDPALSLTDVQRVLGHVNLSTTQHYIRQHDTDVLARIAEHLQERANPKSRPAPPALRYDRDDLDELMGDSAW